MCCHTCAELLHLSLCTQCCLCWRNLCALAEHGALLGSACRALPLQGGAGSQPPEPVHSLSHHPVGAPQHAAPKLALRVALSLPVHCRPGLPAVPGRGRAGGAMAARAAAASHARAQRVLARAHRAAGVRRAVAGAPLALAVCRAATRPGLCRCIQARAASVWRAVCGWCDPFLYSVSPAWPAPTGPACSSRALVRPRSLAVSFCS